jgi:hypothetical protein
MLQIVKYPYQKTLGSNYYVTKFIGSIIKSFHIKDRTDAQFLHYVVK